MKRALCFVLLLSCSTVSAQMQLQRISEGQTTEFIYQISASSTLSFKLDNKLLNQYRGMRRYMPHMADQAVRHALLRKAAALQHNGARVQFSPPNLPLQYSVQAAEPEKAREMMATLAAEQQKALNDYLAKGYYYLLDDPIKGKGVIPDHLLFMQDALGQLQPVADAFIANYGKNNIRQIAAQLTAWVQQIPYRDLDNRIESNGNGYAPPVQLIFDHSGDCDSKAVLWATVMRLIFPTLMIKIIYLPNHAVIAAQVPATDTEQVIDFADSSLLLIDPTGPAQLKLGQVGAEYQAALQSKQFSQRTFPTLDP
ncbi:hypothetical protein [Rheinheimera texasensis]|uniref:hypothetical protein n=1 Tax=Rheinheimera texasensis TaxID=306205 RepID=UPI0012FF453C|nr:hypothetical protein [Rheinheimera texasensis]